MKIDDASKETMLRMMAAGVVPGGEAVDADSAGLKTPTMLSQESFELLVGEALLNFAEKMDRGQNILRNLPADVRSVILTNGILSENRPASLEQGLAFAVQAQRKFVETIKTLAQDFEILKNIPLPQRTLMLPSNLGQRLESIFQHVQNSTVKVPAQALQGTTLSQFEAVLIKFAASSASAPSFPSVFSNWMAGNPLTAHSADPATAVAYRLLEPLIVQVAPSIRDMAHRQQRNDSVLLSVVLKAVSTGQIELLQPEVKEKIYNWLAQGSAVLAELPDGELAEKTWATKLAVKLESIVKQLSSQPIIKQELDDLLATFVEAEAASDGGEFLRTEIPAKLFPPEVREAATKLGQPALVKLWQDLKVNDLQQWAMKDTPQLEKTAQALREIAALFDVPKDSSPQNRAGAGSTSYSWQLVFYPAGPEKPYPALIQVYRDGGDSESGSGPKREDLWIRVAIKTENIGVVDLSFHLRGGRFLSIVTRFADSETAAMFREWRSEMIKELSSEAFDLRAFQIFSRMSETEG